MVVALFSAVRFSSVDIQGCKRKAVFIILAVMSGKVLRTKPDIS